MMITLACRLYMVLAYELYSMLVYDFYALIVMVNKTPHQKGEFSLFSISAKASQGSPSGCADTPLPHGSQCKRRFRG
jgi:hypothetical protein